MKRKKKLGKNLEWFYKGEVDELFNNIMDEYTLGDITKVEFYDHVSLDGDSTQVLAVEVDNKIALALDLGYGLIVSKDNLKKLEKAKCFKKVLYTYNKVDYQSDIKLIGMYMVILHRNTKLVNTMKDTELKSSDYLEFIDKMGNTFFVDIIENHLYKRLNLYGVKHSGKSVRIKIFEEFETTKVSQRYFNNYVKKMVKKVKDMEF